MQVLVTVLLRVLVFVTVLLRVLVLVILMLIHSKLKGKRKLEKFKIQWSTTDFKMQILLVPKNSVNTNGNNDANTDTSNQFTKTKYKKLGVGVKFGVRFGEVDV